MKMTHFLTVACLSAALNIAPPALAETNECRVKGADSLKIMPHKHSSLESEIMALERETCRLIQAGKIDELMDTYIAPHGMILLDKGGVARNREAQRQMFKQFIGAGFGIIYEPADAHVSRSEDMAWAIGAYELTYPDGSNEFGKYTSVWEKSEGRWLNVVEMRNANGGFGLKN